MRSPVVRVAVALALLLTGCATSTVKPSGAGAPVKFSALQDHGTVQAKPANQAMEFELDEFYFEPTFIKAKPGSTVKLLLQNEGEEQHSLEIESLAVSVKTHPGNKKHLVNVTLPGPGKYVFWCKFHHRLGMQGAIVVEDTPAA